MEFIHSKQIGSYWVVKPSVALIEKDVHLLRDLLNHELEIGHTRVALDLSECKQACSLALGVIIKHWKQFVGQGGNLIMFRPTPYVQRLFSETKLDREITIAENEEQLAGL